MLAAIAVSLVVFFANDLYFLTDPSYTQFVIFEFSYRVGLILIWLFVPRIWKVEELGMTYLPEFTAPFRTIILPSVLLIFLFSFQISLSQHVNPFSLFTYPKPDNSLLFFLDATLGLCLVSFSETIVFVVCPLFIGKDKGIPLRTVVVITSIIFGLQHWSHGLFPVLAIVVSHIYLLNIAIKYKSIGSILIVHYLLDAYFFAFKPYVFGAFS